jgi:hypothetical protein
MRPGIASADRRHRGPFASLLEKIRQQDEGALDGLAFAYGELGEADRQALVHAVLQDTHEPIQPLVAFLAVEESPRLRQRLLGLVRTWGKIKRSASLGGDSTQGEARLMQSLGGLEIESLRITWEDNEINHIEIEPCGNLRLDGLLSSVTVSEAIEIVTPLLWAHIRARRGLPPEVERFAGFFGSLSLG